jgi:hypothetical protein
MVGRLHREQPRLRGGVIVHPLIAVEMVGADVQEHRDVAVEAPGEVDLVGGELEHIDPDPIFIWRQRLLVEDRKPDIAPHRRGDSGGGQDVVDQGGGGRLAVGAGDPHHLVRRQVRPGLRE